MRIPCPYCGERDVSEFHYHGGPGRARPDAAAPEAVAEFVDYVYLRDNPAGPHEELWYHSFGCRAWIVVRRNTLTHEVSGSEYAVVSGKGAR